MDAHIEKVIRKLAERDSNSTQEDVEKVINRIDRYIRRESYTQAKELLKDWGVRVIHATSCDFYLQNGDVEELYGTIYIQRFGENAFTLRMEKNDEWIISCLVHGKTIIGTGSKRYREYILWVLDECKQRKESIWFKAE